MPPDLLSRFGMQLPKEFALILPQVQLGIFALGILLTDFLLDRKSRWWNAVLALAGVGFSAKALLNLRNLEDVSAYHGAIVVDPFAVFFSFLFLISAALVILLSVRYLEIEEEHHGEFYALLLLATIGMIRVLMWGDGTGFMFTIGATLVAIPLLGCTVGSMLPLLLRRVGVDPATSSTPFIATLIDVLGIIVYFNLAQLFLAQVIASHMIHAAVPACPPCPGTP